jgi:two-component system, NarL family, response regulator LiaR
MSGTAIRVIIADDHHVVREGLRMILSESDGIEVVGEAADGAAAVRLAATLAPHVVLMDVSMPGMDGIEAARALHDAGSPVRVLILSSFAESDRVREALRAGVAGYLMKDVLSTDLVAAIRNAAAGIPTLHPQVQAQLMREVSTPRAASPLEVLTPREKDVLLLLASGLGNKQIAGRLSISVGTVKGYVSDIFEKLGVGDRTQAALLAVRHGLVE